LVFHVGITICHFFYQHIRLSWGYYYFYYNHPIIIIMFIGQDISLEVRRATQAERRAANNVMAAPASTVAAVAERTSSASLPLFALSPPAEELLTPTTERTFALFGLPMGAAAGLLAADPSADVATVTAAAPPRRLQAFGTSVAPPPRRTAQHNDQVPKKFPGEKGIMRPNMAPFLLVIFSLMDTVRPHVEVGHRNSRATSKWKELYQCFFDRTDGVGRQFELWGGMMGGKSSKRPSCVLFLAIPRPMRRTRGLRRML
jgi:hypothetical protein